MMNDPLELQDVFREYGVESRVDEYNIVLIDVGPMHMWISPRPHYCDRGRWLVHVESSDPIKLHIDGADGFPRYYYTVTALVTEVCSFMKAHEKELSAADD